MTEVVKQKGWKKFLPQHWPLAAIIAMAIVALLVIGSLVLDRLYYNRIYPGVQVGNIELSGKTMDEAEYYIQEAAKPLDDGLVFYYQDQELRVKPILNALSIESSQQLFTADPHQTALNAYAVGRDFNFLINIKDKLWGLLWNRPVNLAISLDQDKLKQLLQEKFDQFLVPVQNAGLAQDVKGNFFVSPEKPGLSLEYDQALTAFRQQLAVLNLSPIALKDSQVKPEIYQHDVLNIDNQAKQVLSLAPLTWQYREETWTVEKEQLLTWLDLQWSGEKKNQQVVVGLNKEALAKYLEEEVAAKLDQPAQEARFKMTNKKVVAFQNGQDGWGMDMEASIKNIVEAIASRQSQANLVVNETKAVTDQKETNELGLEEIVGTGRSNFSGSPTNRRHNIKVGADTLNGLLIKPGEEFSLIRALGAIDASGGYLPELVIRDNKTTPEYGGGLCQIGTTMFRAALDTGLPITMRRNHSYRVGYYEPAGTDATIYDPLPDLRFVNDLNNYILIQTRIEGDNVVFDFWGTGDGRQVEQTKPVIYNIVEPAPTKIVETTDLPAGQKKCTERAHNGADAYFTRTITKADGEVTKETFSSHYVPWQEVCLVGVDQLSPPSEETTDATTTDGTVESGLGVYQRNRDATANTTEP